jgi:low temperature requirement protein LtrA
MDALSNELHMISEHAVQLDASFSKYGYSARLRTKDASDESTSTSLYGENSSSFDKAQWDAERKLGETMRFYQKPIVRQYFHKGLLWRAPEAQEVASYELFVDLFYVGIIAITGDTAAEHPTGESLLRFAITFTMGWKFWSDISVLISWFDSDDILRRFSVLFILTCLLGFTTNMAAAFSETYIPMVAFYLAARLFIALSLAWYAWEIPMVRGSMVGSSILIVVPAALWIGSIYVEEPTRQGLIWPALMFDVFGQSLLILCQRPSNIFGDKYVTWAKKAFEFTPGANIEHRIERTAAFVTLVFGSCVLGLLYQSSVEFGINAFFGKAVLGLIQAFTFNWLYFEMDSFNLHTHAIRRHVFSGKSSPSSKSAGKRIINMYLALIWFTVHLPFVMSFVLSASALGVLVRAHDCPDAPVESLYETFIPRSEDHISQGLRWFYCGGLSISLACMTIISMAHVHKKIPHQRINKHYRLIIRFAVSLAILLLPLAHLNSLDLIGTTTGLVLSVLFLELWGATCTGQNILWESKCGRNKCQYSAKCKVSKKELEDSMKNGNIINVEEIAARDENEKGVVGGV